MVGAIELVAAGFLGGVILTGIAACYLHGLLHTEAVRSRGLARSAGRSLRSGVTTFAGALFHTPL